MFGLSFASFALIVLYALYELLYPCLNARRLKLQARLDYTRRYNREQHDLVRPYAEAELGEGGATAKITRKRRGAKKVEKEVEEVQVAGGEGRQSVGVKIANIIGKGNPEAKYQSMPNESISFDASHDIHDINYKTKQEDKKLPDDDQPPSFSSIQNYQSQQQQQPSSKTNHDSVGTANFAAPSAVARGRRRVGEPAPEPSLLEVPQPPF